jgi:hypothetical protein
MRSFLDKGKYKQVTREKSAAMKTFFDLSLGQFHRVRKY